LKNWMIKLLGVKNMEYENRHSDRLTTL